MFRVAMFQLCAVFGPFVKQNGLVRKKICAGYLASLTQARVIGEEETATEEFLPSARPAGEAVWLFS